MDVTDRISSELTRRDAAAEKRARKRGRHYNIYALSLELGAVQDMRAAISNGADPALAFAAEFVATAKNHSIARKVGFPLDVKRGAWVDTRTDTWIY